MNRRSPVTQRAFAYNRKIALSQTLFVTLVAAFLVMYAIYTERMGDRLAVVVMLLPAGAFLYSRIRRLTTSEPAVVIDASGVRILEVSPLTIPWPHIREVRIVGRKRPLIAFDVDAPEHYILPAATLRGLLHRLPSLIGIPPLSLRPHDLEAKIEDLVAAIEHFRAQASEEGSSSLR